MKKFLVILLCAFFVSGCAPYKVVRGTKPPAKDGYVFLRDGVMLPEYTIGEGGLAPDNVYLAKERFKRRRKTVEAYYKKMGVIENRFKENIPDRLGYTLGMVGSVFTLPVRTVKSYRHEYDLKYRARVDRADAEKDALEKTRLEKLRADLNNYIKQDVEQEKRDKETKAAVK